MADTTASGADRNLKKDEDADSRPAEKRKSTDSTGDAAPPKKMSFSIGMKPAAAASQKISFNLGGSLKPSKLQPAVKPSLDKPQVMPIKMSLSTTQKAKEAPPVVQKSALAAKVFDDDDESDEEEMPPEAKMRMKNIGRDTPTAAGPNSYGKGKHGFIDRQKVIEKQLKEEMDRISGDKEGKK